MSNPNQPKAKPDTMTAFRSAMQIIYEQLMLAFADSMETLRELQVQDKHTESRAEASEVAVEKAPPLVDLANMHEVERKIAAMVDARELPTQRELQRLQRDLEALNAALDERLAAHERA